MSTGTLVFITAARLDLLSGAQSARMLCYAKALSIKGISVIFTSVYYSFQKDEKLKIIEENIYLLGNNERLEGHSRRALPVIKEFNFISTLCYLRQLNIKYQKQKDLTFLLYPSNFALSLATALYFRAIKRNIVFIEKNELHLGIALNLPSPVGFLKILFFPALFFQILLGALTDFIEIFFDGMICISTRMYKLYDKAYKNLVLISIITDTENGGIRKPEQKKTENFKIGYTGTLTEKRDGIFTLIKAISLIPLWSQNKIECNLYGSITRSNKKHLTHLINKCHLNEIVRYFGNYDSVSIKSVQSEHNLLVLPRPSNLQTNFGFSTKLAEYLSSGVPVLTTRHSDVSNYLIDGGNGFIVDKHNPVLLKNKLIEILNNKDQLAKIGEKGRETALKYFNYSNYSSTLFNFLFHKK